MKRDDARASPQGFDMILQASSTAGSFGILQDANFSYQSCRISTCENATQGIWAPSRRRDGFQGSGFWNVAGADAVRELIRKT